MGHFFILERKGEDHCWWWRKMGEASRRQTS